ncbi:hypothetical protein QZH41_018069 [Actinostola sp. cb2023]|nr:hypothetical protein QZH41_018069 [Actinostola sp. cb2023]
MPSEPIAKQHHRQIIRIWMMFSLILTTISPKVDDLISGLYAPISRENLQENVHQLADILDNLLGKSRASRFTLETDNSWIDFLKKAIDHNKTKLMAIMTEQLSL